MLFYPEHAEQWQLIGTAIDAADTVFIATHVNPDGDALGSEMALYRFLDSRGKKVRVVNTSKTPDMYRFLDPEDIIETVVNGGIADLTGKPGPDDLVVFLDLGVIDRVGEAARFLLGGGPKTAMIDHHLPEHSPVDLAVVNPTSESTGSLVYDLIRAIDHTGITRDIAEAALTAVVTDSGYFSYSNTSARTLHIAASLYEHGVSARDLRRRLEAVQPLRRQRLLGLCLAETQVSHCGRIAWSTVTTDMLEKTGCGREHTDGIINEIRIIEGISVAMLIIQEGPATWKLSLRSMSGIPVNLIAADMGGGGHEKAAGATLIGSYDEALERALETITRALDAAQR